MNATWVYDLNTRKWEAGVPMLSSRYFHSCSTIKDSSGKMYVIVTGGEIGSYFKNPTTWEWESTLKVTNTVEVFNLETKKWTQIDDLPRPISGSSMIKDDNGGILIVGGDDTGTWAGAISDIFYLSDKDSSWQHLFKSLDEPTSHHVGMLVPDHLIEC